MTKININVAEKFAREALVAIQNLREQEVDKLINDYLFKNKRKTNEDALKYINDSEDGRMEVHLIKTVFLEKSYSTAQKVINNCKALSMMEMDKIDLNMDTIDSLYKVLNKDQINHIKVVKLLLLEDEGLPHKNFY